MKCAKCKFTVTGIPGEVLSNGRCICQSCVAMQSVERLDKHYAKLENESWQDELKKEDMEGFDIAIDQD